MGGIGRGHRDNCAHVNIIEITSYTVKENSTSKTISKEINVAYAETMYRIRQMVTVEDKLVYHVRT